jgi:adenylate kinase family enzyme
VAIIGCSGSGKSTLAGKLAERTGLPLIHLDREYWKPGWVEPDRDAWKAQVAELARRPAWIMDGNFGRTLAVRLQAADTVVLLDFPRWRCLVRVLRRTIFGRGKVRDDMGPGCPERFDLEFLRWIWRRRRDSRPRVLAALATAAGEVYILRRPAEVIRFLEQTPYSTRPNSGQELTG